jgi:hypothetical protein
MKTSSVPVQCELFANVPAVATLGILQRHHDELVELLSRLMWEVAQGVGDKMTRESLHEQDQR